MTRAASMMNSFIPHVDHLVYVCANLDEGIEHIEQLVGVRAARGGSHPGHGTQNALLSLGEQVYLEIVAPDPAQERNLVSKAFSADPSGSPRLKRWVTKMSLDRIKALTSMALPENISIGNMAQGGRNTLDGEHLSWTYSDPNSDPCQGAVPFLIHWGSTPHPAQHSPLGGEFISLKIEHPSPNKILAVLGIMELDIPVTFAKAPKLVALIEGQKGRVELS